MISTAFRRRIVESLTTFDCGIRNKTVVFDTIGDSANLLISKLVTGDNRIICLQNGFLALDKLFYMGDTTYSLDQLEAHQMARSFPRLYGAVINFNFVPMFKVVPNFKPVAAYMALVRRIQHFLGTPLHPGELPRSLRGYAARDRGRSPSQGSRPKRDHCDQVLADRHVCAAVFGTICPNGSSRATCSTISCTSCPKAW